VAARREAAGSRYAARAGRIEAWRGAYTPPERLTEQKKV